MILRITPLGWLVHLSGLGQVVCLGGSGHTFVWVRSCSAIRGVRIPSRGVICLGGKHIAWAGASLWACTSIAQQRVCSSSLGSALGRVGS